MTLHKTVFFALLALLPWNTLAQTKAPAKAPAKTNASASSHGAIVVEPGSEQWGDVPAAALVGTPSVEMGGTLKIAIIQGDPMTAGRSYTIRLSCTDGLKVAPHWHPTTENLTVISGTFYLGTGDKMDESKATAMTAGAFGSMPAKMHHYAWTKGETEVQIHAMGPFQLTYVNPADDPQQKKM